MRPRDDLDDRLHVLHRVQGLELELPDQLGDDRLLLHEGEPLADAVARPGREGQVGERVAGGRLFKTEAKSNKASVKRHLS